MIIAHHFAVHGGFSFPINSITINRLWYQFIIMGGSLGNSIFVLISGYFLIKSPVINFRRMFNLWLRIFIYSVIIFCAFIFSGLEAFSLKTALKVIMPITKSQWWFASTYFVMYLVHPYINILLNGFTQDDYKKFLIAIFIYWSIIPTLTKSDFQSNALVNFICLYSLAGYFRLWASDFGNKKFILYGITCILVNYVSAILLDVIGLKIQLAARGSIYFFGMMRPFTILGTLCLLLGFRSLEIPHSKIINLLASATFGVYLIHDNNFVRPFLWHKVFMNASFQNSPYLIPYSIGVVLLVYVMCTLIELARSRIFKALSRGYLS